MRNLLRNLAAVVALLLSTGLLAQTNPGFYSGQVPTAGQWNSYFAGKSDYPLSAATVGAAIGSTCSAHKWLNSLSTFGILSCSQPGVADLTGLGAGIGAALGIAVDSAGAPVLYDGDLGTPSSGTGTNITGVNAAELGGATFASPGAIGGTTAAAGKFTTLSASGQVTSTVSTGTAPLVIASTTEVANLNAATASALAATPTQCSGSQVSVGIAASGNANCATPSYQDAKGWVDVTSGTNGCAAAVGNGVADDHAAIQCQINYLNTTFAGGTAFFPCGTYFLNGNTLTVTGATVMLRGAERKCVVIENTTDATVISFPPISGGGVYGGLIHLTIEGYQNSAATQDVVAVGLNDPTMINDAEIIGGRYALNTNGIDGTVFNSYLSGYTGGVISSGANWYIRDKIDGPWGSGVGTTYAYQQNGHLASGVTENHFTQCDFSGSATTWTSSINISDTGGTTVSVFDSNVTAAEISLTTGVQIFNANELGSTSFAIGAGDDAIVVGNWALGSTTISVSGVLKCSGNINIANAGC